MSFTEWLKGREPEAVVGWRIEQRADAAAGRHVEQPAPVANDRPPVWPLVIMDMANRDQVGRARYGVPLQPHNGRDALMDAYQEALGLCAYLKQALMERDGQ